MQKNLDRPRIRGRSHRKCQDLIKSTIIRFLFLEISVLFWPSHCQKKDKGIVFGATASPVDITDCLRTESIPRRPTWSLANKPFSPIFIRNLDHVPNLILGLVLLHVVTWASTGYLEHGNTAIKSTRRSRDFQNLACLLEGQHEITTWMKRLKRLLYYYDKVFTNL